MSLRRQFQGSNRDKTPIKNYTQNEESVSTQLSLECRRWEEVGLGGNQRGQWNQRNVLNWEMFVSWKHSGWEGEMGGAERRGKKEQSLEGRRG